MMLSTPVFISLLVLSGVGILLGGFYYYKPEKIVSRRVKSSQWRAAQKDPEFKKWLEAEFLTQVKKTRSMGMIMIVLEAILMVLIISLWLKG